MDSLIPKDREEIQLELDGADRVHGVSWGQSNSFETIISWARRDEDPQEGAWRQLELPSGKTGLLLVWHGSVYLLKENP